MWGYKERVIRWCRYTFGIAVAENKDEAIKRFLEEALELAQACGLSYGDALKLLTYVYNRDAGEVGQEMGGTMVCLYRLGHVINFDPDDCGELELQRCWERFEIIRRKHSQKPDDIKGDYT